ncbi:hypothetical protein [Pseudonocardia cypriaca]|uniref:Uncharacterized protein n=1 Tax=Pseudonocardia cypriaca TaxID=882449 RepID=A0A543FVT2_9PSEU|nr:hypothetical protein [Pseudonocardia cypriaca]TQM37931.1 hypothetical protein FB388_5150 [Pseudonocardia cypriaca]
MTIPNPAEAPLLLTDSEVHRRVEQLVGRATATRQLWIMFVDGDGRQAPVILPISDIPPRPEAPVIDNLAAVMAGMCADLTTDVGGGSVILTLERIGRDAVLAGDRQWADALREACVRTGADVRGIYLSTSGGIHRILSG